MPPYFCRAFAVLPITIGTIGRQVKIKLLKMEQKKKYRGIWGLVFLVSTAALIFAIYSQWEWLTLILPFLATSFVKAMDIV
jgi:uncharacterized membrane protein YjjP (DUF1212 family)